MGAARISARRGASGYISGGSTRKLHAAEYRPTFVLSLEPNMAEIPEARRRIQLSLTTIMLLIAIAAVAIAWWTDHSRLVQQLQARNLQIMVFSLQNADAAKAAAALNEQFPDSKSDPTRISVDARTNGLIVSASSETLTKIEALLLNTPMRAAGPV